MTNFALNPFKKGKKTEVEGVRKVEVEGEHLITKTLEQYKKLLDLDWLLGEEKFEKELNDLEKVILTPEQINGFLGYVIKKDLIKGNYYSQSSTTGEFISKLIRDSYDAGHNNFFIDGRDERIDRMGRKLNGTKDNPINLKFDDIGSEEIGSESSYLNVIITNSIVEYPGRYSRRCNFNIFGDTEDPGMLSKQSSFTIHGETKDSIGGDSRASIFYLLGKINMERWMDDERTEYSTYKVLTDENYEILSKFIPEYNTIQLVDANGKVLKEDLR